MTDAMAFLIERLHAAGLADVVAAEPASGGLAATAGIARRSDGTSVFVKAFGQSPSDDAFAAEAEGLTVLREPGGVATPEIILAERDVLVLSVLQPRPSTEAFWEQLAHAVARLHTVTQYPRFGWHRDNWLGRRRQVGEQLREGVHGVLQGAAARAVGVGHQHQLAQWALPLYDYRDNSGGTHQWRNS